MRGKRDSGGNFHSTEVFNCKELDFDFLGEGFVGACSVWAGRLIDMKIESRVIERYLSPGVFDG